MASPRCWLGLVCGAAFAAALWAAEPMKPPADVKMPPAEPDPARPANEPRPPGGVTLTAKENQDLLDEIARLKAQLGADRPEPPSSCRLSGQVAGDTARLVLEFDFRTHQPYARAALGCDKGEPWKTDLDKHPVRLHSGPDGLFVQVAEPGDHKLVLEIDLRLAAREPGGGEWGLDLDLPAAPVTVIDDLRLPAGIKKVRAVIRRREGPPDRQATREAFDTSAADGTARLKTPGLGPVERLELTWESGAARPAQRPVVEQSQVHVTVDDKQVTTRAKLTLRVRPDQLREWQLLVPTAASVRCADERVEPIDPSAPKGPRRTLRLKDLKEIGDEPLEVTVELQQPRGGRPLPVGPFLVLGAVPQRGDVLVSAPPDTRLDYQPRGETHYTLSRRELTEEEKRRYPAALAVRYGVLAAADPAKAPPLFDLTADRITGVVEAVRVNHALRLEPGDGGRLAWQVTTTVEARPVRTQVERLQVQLPAGLGLDEKFGAVPADDFQQPETDPVKGVVTVPLARPRKDAFTLTLRGRYAADAGSQGQAVLGLPVPLEVQERACQVSVALPDDLELLPSGPLWDRGKREQHNRRTWDLEQLPRQFAVAWKPYQPDVSAEARVQLWLNVADRQATVEHRLWLAPPPPAGKPLALRVPEEAFGLRVVAAGENPPELHGKEGGPRAVTFSTAPDKDHPLVLRYSFRLPEQATAPFKVPLVVPETATRGETLLLVWADPGLRPEPVEGRWEVCREEVKEAARAPSLTLRARQADLPLALRLPEAAGGPLASFRVDRALIQAAVTDWGQQTYRARYLLSQVAAPYVDVELPASLPAANLNLKVIWQGVEVTSALTDEGKAGNGAKVVRVPVKPDPDGKPGVLEVAYAMRGGGTWQTVLSPPQLRGDPGLAPARWHVALPPAWVLLHDEGALGREFGWGWRGWLVGPRAAGAADRERWAYGPEGSQGEKEAAAPVLVCWGATGEPLRLTHAPQQVWLLLCSLVLLAVGVSLAFLPLPRLVFWAVVAAVGAGALLAELGWPRLLGAVLYGCQPGAIVLLPLLGLHWLMQRHYRRQVLFLPSFARLKTGSSLNRGRPREPSTGDAPPAGSSQQSGTDNRKAKAEGSPQQTGSSVLR